MYIDPISDGIEENLYVWSEIVGILSWIVVLLSELPHHVITCDYCYLMSSDGMPQSRIQCNDWNS